MKPEKRLQNENLQTAGNFFEQDGELFLGRNPKKNPKNPKISMRNVLTHRKEIVKVEIPNSGVTFTHAAPNSVKYHRVKNKNRKKSATFSLA